MFASTAVDVGAVPGRAVAWVPEVDLDECNERLFIVGESLDHVSFFDRVVTRTHIVQ